MERPGFAPGRTILHRQEGEGVEVIANKKNSSRLHCSRHIIATFLNKKESIKHADHIK